MGASRCGVRRRVDRWRGLGRLRWCSVLGLQHRRARVDLLQQLRLAGDLAGVWPERVLWRCHPHLCGFNLRDLAQPRPVRCAVHAAARDDPSGFLVLWRRTGFQRGPPHPVPHRVQQLDQPSHRLRLTRLEQHLDLLQLEPPKRSAARQRANPLPPNLRLQHLLRLLVHR